MTKKNRLPFKMSREQSDELVGKCGNCGYKDLASSFCHVEGSIYYLSSAGGGCPKCKSRYILEVK